MTAPTYPVIKHVDVIKYISPSLIPVCIDNARALVWATEKTLHHSVIMAIASPTHAGNQAVLFEKILPFVDRKLTTVAIQIKNHSP